MKESVDPRLQLLHGDIHQKIHAVSIALIQGREGQAAFRPTGSVMGTMTAEINQMKESVDPRLQLLHRYIQQKIHAVSIALIRGREGQAAFRPTGSVMGTMTAEINQMKLNVVVLVLRPQPTNPLKVVILINFTAQV